MKDQRLKLTPLTRLILTINNEMELDGGRLFDHQRYERCVSMLKVAEARRDQMLKALLFSDAAIVLILSGRAFTLPLIGMSVSEIPAALEIATFAASISFMFFANAQFNWHGYSTLVDGWVLSRARGSGVDPEFVGAADKFMEFVVKVFRPKMNIYGPDLFVPLWGFKFIARTIVFLFVLAVFSFLIIHLAVVGYSLRSTAGSNLDTLIKVAYFAFVSVAQFAGLLLLFVIGKSFQFSISKASESEEPSTPNAAQ